MLESRARAPTTGFLDLILAWGSESILLLVRLRPDASAASPLIRSAGVSFDWAGVSLRGLVRAKAQQAKDVNGRSRPDLELYQLRLGELMLRARLRLAVSRGGCGRGFHFSLLRVPLLFKQEFNIMVWFCV